jgi:hypothetical protein
MKSLSPLQASLFAACAALLGACAPTTREYANGSGAQGGGGQGGAGQSSVVSGTGGAGGEPECVDPTDCPALQGPCFIPTCDAGVCGVTQMPDGTPLMDDVAGDCKAPQCLMGNVALGPDDADIPDDGLECTSNACMAGEPYASLLPPGAACSLGGCNEKGDCVNHCEDNAISGNETDVDCGGGECLRCTKGKGCIENLDCIKFHYCCVSDPAASKKGYCESDMTACLIISATPGASR